VLGLIFVVGCASTSSSVVESTPEGTAETVRLTGDVRYEARHPLHDGASRAVEVRPARLVDVVAADDSGRILASTRTDDAGRFAFDAPGGATRLVVQARVHHDGHDLAVSTTRNGQGVHGIETPVGPTGGEHRLLASDAADGGPAGAFHIVDSLLDGSRAVRAWTGRTLAPFFAYWGRGRTTSWSYYHGECPEGSGRYCIELLGGDPGQQETTDCDEHDEAIILHEFGHFVMDQLTTSSSYGGDHPQGFLIDPGLAWEEGRASWFAISVLGRPYYQDTIGMQPRGSLRVNHDAEHRPQDGGLRGLGSEMGVLEILWDLTDGEGGIEDADADGLAIGPARLLSEMIALREVPGAYPSIADFLRFLVARNVVSSDAVKGLLERGGHPEELLPAADAPVWPADIALPGTANGKIDGLTDPAPSGGPNRPDTGFDAVVAYRVHVPERARLSARLRIFGSGRVGDRTDLDLELRDIRAELVTSARTEAQIETLGAAVDAGYYVLYVRDGGNGNRAGYELEVELF
jgi:hypothetical protein